MRKLVFCIPSYSGQVDIRVAGQLFGLAATLPYQGIACDMFTQVGVSILPNARDNLVRAFLQDQTSDYLLFLDDDVVFKAADVLRLLKWAEEDDVDVVGGMYRVKRPDTVMYMCHIYNEDSPETNKSGGLLRMRRMPMGFCLIKRNVFLDIMKARPDLKWEDRNMGEMFAFFEFERRDGKRWGEDYFFCDLVDEVGRKMFCDPLIQLIHVGRFDYTGRFADLLQEERYVTINDEGVWEVGYDDQGQRGEDDQDPEEQGRDR